MTTRKDIQARLTEAESSLSTLTQKIAKDRRRYLAGILAKGPHAALDALIDGKLILAPADRVTLRNAMGASMSPKRRWRRWLPRRLSWREVRYTVVATLIVALKVAIVTAPVSAWLYAAYANTASWHPAPPPSTDF